MNCKVKLCTLIGLAVLVVVGAIGENGERALGSNLQAEASTQDGGKPHQPETHQFLSFDFEGGTAEQYVATVRRAAGHANIVTFGNLSAYPVPPTQLRNVTVWSALELLRSLPRDKEAGRAGIDVSWNAPLPRGVSMQQTIFDGEASPVYVVSAQVSEAATRRSESHLTVLEISEILESGVRAPDALTAVETALSMQGQTFEPPDIRFHEATGILIVRGHPTLTNTAQQVVGQLHEKAKRGRQQARLMHDVDAAKAHAHELEGLLTQCRDENQLRIQQLTEFKTRAEFLERELHEARERIAALEVFRRSSGIDALEKKSDKPQ